MAATQRFQRVTDLHGTILKLLKGRARQAESSKNGFYPAGGRTARDLRFLSHGAVECQPTAPNRSWSGPRKINEFGQRFVSISRFVLRSRLGLFKWATANCAET